MKSFSTLNISYGLLNFSVKLYPLRDKIDNINFVSLSDCCKSITKLKRICKSCAKELSWRTELKGFKLGKNNYVELSLSELTLLNAWIMELRYFIFPK